MLTLIAYHDRLAKWLAGALPLVLPTLARLCFAAVLFFYFWASAQTKLGPGLLGFLHPSDGAYVQIFPKAMEAVGYDASQLSLFHWAVAVAGILAEITLPALILAGLFTRLAALGMLGFILVQSLTDIWGHGVLGDDLGRWFDAASGSLILDQRGLWAFLLIALFFTGAGPISLDRLLLRVRGSLN
jgi:putative oxidoreductase